MKKKIFSIILAVCLIVPCMFMIAGCKKKSEPSKYADIVKQINADQEFAQQHASELVKNTIESGFKFAYEDSESQSEMVISYSRGVIYAYYKDIVDSWDEKSLFVYGEDCNYTIYESDIDVSSNEEMSFMDCAKESSPFVLIEYATEFSAKAYKNYYRISATMDEVVMTFEVANGVITKLIDDETDEVVEIKPISDAEVNQIISEYDYSVLDTMYIAADVDATEVDLDLFEQVNTIILDEGVVLSEDAELYISNNFIEEFEGYWVRNIVEE